MEHTGDLTWTFDYLHVVQSLLYGLLASSRATLSKERPSHSAEAHVCLWPNPVIPSIDGPCPTSDRYYPYPASHTLLLMQQHTNSSSPLPHYRIAISLGRNDRLGQIARFIEFDSSIDNTTKKDSSNETAAMSETIV